MKSQITTHTSPSKDYTLTPELAKKFRVRLFANCVTFTSRVVGGQVVFSCSHRLADCEEHYEAVMERK